MSENQRNSTLVSLVQQVGELEQAMIESGGEITEAIEQMLVVTEINLPAKIDGYSEFIDRMDMIEEFYKEKADFYLRLAGSAAGLAKRCKDNLKLAMQTLGTQEITGFDIKFKLIPSNPSCVVDDEGVVDGSYKITETITRIDKKRIAEDLKLGVPVSGAHLERGVSLRKYANSAASKKSKPKKEIEA